MRTVMAIILLLLCYSCRSNESDNAKRIRSIDEIKDIDTTYEFLVDSNSRIIDTLSMYRYKKNGKGIKLFSEITSLESDINKTILKNYFRDNGELFYSVTETAAGLLSIYENWDQDGRIYKAATVSYETGKAIDTVSMFYKYDFDRDGKVQKLQINESDGSKIAEVHYNEEQKPILEVYSYYNDTTRVERFTYKGSKLISKRILDKRKGRETIQYFDANEFRNAEKVYVSDSLIREVVFSRDNRENILAKVIK